MEYYSAIKNNKTLAFNKKWKNMKDSLLSEASQAMKERHCISALNIYQVSSLYDWNWLTKGYRNTVHRCKYQIQCGWKRMVWARTFRRKIRRQSSNGTKKCGIICWRYFVVLSTVLGSNVHLLKYPLCKTNNSIFECMEENEKNTYAYINQLIKD